MNQKIKCLYILNKAYGNEDGTAGIFLLSKTLVPFLLFERIVIKEREFFRFKLPAKEIGVNIFGISLGGMGPHNPREASASLYMVLVAQ